MSSVLKLPRVSVVFDEAAQAATAPAGVGRLAIVVKDVAISKASVMTFTSLPEALAAAAWTEANKQALTFACYGAPASVLVAAVPDTAELSAGYTLLEAHRFDVCTVAGLTGSDAAAFVTWAKRCWDTLDMRALFVAAGASAPDHPAVVLVEVSSAAVAGVALNTPSFALLPLIASMIVGLPLWEAVTYLPLPIVSECAHVTRAEADTLIGAGKLTLIHDGAKVKIARGVTSLTTTTGEYSEAWRKIKVVRILARIENDVKRLVEDVYIGRMPNTYINKRLLVVAILDYLKTLEGAGVLIENSSTVDIDVGKQRTYLKTLLPVADVDAMTDQAVMEADTGDQLFLLGTVHPIDAIEDVEIRFSL